MSRTSANSRNRLPTRRNASGKLKAATNTIHSELLPDWYTKPGPPTNPKPLITLEIVAMTTTRGPSDFPARKKSEDVCVRRIAQMPMPKQLAR